MLFLSQSRFEQLLKKGGNKALANAYVISLSHENMQIGDDEVGDSNFRSLIPSKDDMEAVINGDMDKRTFLRNYKDSLKSYQNRFLTYTIARSFNERRYLPIFVCSDTEYELGFMKVLKKFLEKSYRMRTIKLKQYLKAIKIVSKDTKKSKKRKKAFIKGMRDFVKDTCQIDIKGLEKLELADRKFAIDRIALLINQSEDPMSEISKKAVLQSINSFAQTKKGKKLIKRHVKTLGISKKSERWSKKDAFNLVLSIYNDIHDLDDESDN